MLDYLFKPNYGLGLQMLKASVVPLGAPPGRPSGFASAGHRRVMLPCSDAVLRQCFVGECTVRHQAQRSPSGV